MSIFIDFRDFITDKKIPKRVERIFISSCKYVIFSKDFAKNGINWLLLLFYFSLGENRLQSISYTEKDGVHNATPFRFTSFQILTDDFTRTLLSQQSTYVSQALRGVLAKKLSKANLQI